MRDTICNQRDHITGFVATSTFGRKAAAIRVWNPREQLNKFAIGLRSPPYCGTRSEKRMREKEQEKRELLALPVGRPLVEEGVHAFAKILAHIGLEDQIFALVARQRTADAAHRL